MSISAPRDENRVPVIMVTSNVDGITPMLVKIIDSTNHTLMAEDGIGGTGFSYKNIKRDDNRVPVLWGVSSVDGVSPIPIYGNPATGAILVRST